MATRRQATAAAVVVDHEEREIPIGLIAESPTQPRRHFDEAALAELAADLKAHGLLQPALVRPMDVDGGRYELVFGARRFRAAKLAGFDTLRCAIRNDLDERGALELQIVENSQRVDVHPLEEAEGYRRLRDEYGFSVDQVAARVGKSKAWVYARLKLCALEPGPREAFLAGKLDASRALLIARMPAELQEVACTDLVDEGDPAVPGTERDPMSYREAQRHLRARYMLNLAGAGFDVTDATLPGNGPCARCPKRTGNEMDLFGDVGDADVCTDPRCFEGKREATWQRQCAPAAAAGVTVLSVLESKEVFSEWQPEKLSYSSDYVDLDEKEWSCGNLVTWREILGEQTPPVVLAQDRKGKAHELVDRKTAEAARKAASANDPRATTHPKLVPGPKPDPSRDSRDRELDVAMTERFIETVVRCAANRKPGDELWRWLISRELRMADPPVCEVAKRRGLLGASDDGDDFDAAHTALKAEADRLKGGGLVALFVELCATPDHYSYLPDNLWIREACDLYGVDRKAVGAEVRKEMKAKAKAEEKAAKGKAATKAKAAAKSTREVRS